MGSKTFAEVRHLAPLAGQVPIDLIGGAQKERTARKRKTPYVAAVAIEES